MNAIFLYLVGLFAARFGMIVSAAILMSTHIHIVLTDVDGRLPDFMMNFNRILALATACYRQTFRTVWDKRKPSVVELLTPQAMLEKIAYTVGNPVADGLVRAAAEWPGTTLRADAHGGHVLEVARPSIFFSERWPARVEIRVGWPPALLQTATAEELTTKLSDEICRIEKAASQDALQSRRQPVGARRILACSPFRRSSTPDRRGDRSPTFAVGRGRRDEYLAAVRVIRAFRAAYRHARERWRTGDHSGGFPPGTWWMTRFHRAKVDHAPSTVLAA